MSFLAELKKKKQTLKTTQTVITQVDGCRYIENNGNKSLLLNNEFGFVVDTKPDNIPVKIIDCLYLGSQDCCQLEILQNYNIKNILSIGIEAPITYDCINYKFVPCLDLPESNLVDILEDCVVFMEKAVKQKSNILVHCNAGVSRSSSVVIGYLMLTNSLSYTEAFNVVKTARPCIQPNAGFQKQLQNLK